MVFKKRKRVPPIPTIRPPRGYDDVDLSTPEESKYETIHDAGKTLDYLHTKSFPEIYYFQVIGFEDCFKYTL